MPCLQGSVSSLPLSPPHGRTHRHRHRHTHTHRHRHTHTHCVGSPCHVETALDIAYSARAGPCAEVIVKNVRNLSAQHMPMAVLSLSLFFCLKRRKKPPTFQAASFLTCQLLLQLQLLLLLLLLLLPSLFCLLDCRAGARARCCSGERPWKYRRRGRLRRR